MPAWLTLRGVGRQPLVQRAGGLHVVQRRMGVLRAEPAPGRHVRPAVK
jgi:hypothetical protein